MKWILAGAAALTLVTTAGAAFASACSNECDHNYSICNAQNGGAAQSICMPKWMQCKKTCTAPAKPMSSAPKPKP